MEEKYKIHAFYILLILGAIIIGLVTIEWAEIPNLVGYITFALTVTSICLALLAIIYSIYSNTAFAQNISSLENSTSALNSTSNKLSLATDELKNKVEDIPDIIKTVGDKVEETHALVSDISTRATAEPVGVEESNKIPETILSNFLTQSSYNGLLVLYVYSLAYKTKTPFDYNQILETINVNKDYSYAFTVACASVGLVNFEEKKDIWIIKGINKYLSDNLSSKLDEKIVDISKGDEDFSNRLKDEKTNAENYFNN